MTPSPTEPQWRKSSYSNGAGGECVEIADLSGVTAVRDSKVPSGPRIAVRHAAWGAFVGALRQRQLG
ncbi:hypothetical protein GCM10011583_19400 [Streptomyces camponoticapitis]|uniref:DUF397 domain-containing protein n=1 Tax=Streptomyces camponoticapitis TaxID=1616125 RepID=A0ABQ2E385_9ACTN|nr:DUF397 domain-containing protein [Streptomyces camponoticapitis]GGJ88076.1 hypothetical protein GCM10011583_19400 [Streptomyces camponoticapitis]